MRLRALRPAPFLVLLIGLLMAAMTGSPGMAQQAPLTASPTTRLDTDKAIVDRLEMSLTRADISDPTLQQMRTELDPVAADLQALITELSPRLDAAKARLDQLGPKPSGDKATPEAADITTERAAQEKLFADLDATVKRAKVLAVQAAQLSDTIGARRRALFTRSVLERSYSIASPPMWSAVAQDLPSDFRALSYLGRDWWNGVAAKTEGWRLSLVGVSVALLLVLLIPLMRVARHISDRKIETKPTRLRAAVLAFWVALSTAAVPVVCVLAIIGVFDAADLITTRLQPIVRSVAIGVAVVGVVGGLARGLLAPRRPTWRLIKISDASAQKLYSLAIALSSIVTASEVLANVNETIAVALPTAVAARAVAVLLVALVMAHALHDIDRIVAGLDTGKAPVGTARNWAGPARLLGWMLVALLMATLLVGYIALGSFVAGQIVYLSGLFALLYLLLILADEGVTASFQPKRRLGRTLLVMGGLQRDALEQIAILISGFFRVVLVAGTVLLVLAPWNVGSGNLLSSIQSAFFGFTLGNVTISLSTIAVAIALFAVGIVITRAVQRWLDVKYLPLTHLDTGLRNSIKTSFGYLGFLAAAAIAAAHLGLSFEKVTYVAGALSVGIGFGLQSVVSNFVSGLIILWERAIRVGDWIVVGGDEGFVRRINVRSTEIETFDRATVVVPNSNLMTGVVKNWVRNDRVGRIRLPLTVGLAADPATLRDRLIGIAKDHEHVLKIPAPAVLFNSFADDKMSFELICFVEDVELGKRTTSDLLFAIHAWLVEKGIVAAPAPAILSSPALERAVDVLVAEKERTAAPEPVQD